MQMAEKTCPSTKADENQFFKELENPSFIKQFQYPTLEERFTRLEKSVDVLLDKHGLLGKRQAIRYSKLTGQLPEVQHAINICNRLDWAREWIKQNNIEMAIHCVWDALRSAQLCNLAVFEPDITRGQKSIASSKKGGETKSALYFRDRQKRKEFALMQWEKDHSLEIAEVARRIINEFGGNFETVRSFIRPLSPKNKK